MHCVKHRLYNSKSIGTMFPANDNNNGVRYAQMTEYQI